MSNNLQKEKSYIIVNQKDLVITVVIRFPRFFGRVKADSLEKLCKYFSSKENKTRNKEMYLSCKESARICRYAIYCYGELVKVWKSKEKKQDLVNIKIKFNKEPSFTTFRDTYINVR